MKPIVRAALAASLAIAAPMLFADPLPDNPLSLDQAVQLALTDQPLLIAREATIEADEQQAIAARQLPDPSLSAGLKDVPVEDAEAYSLRRDDFTEWSVGLTQAFPRANKRRLKGERKQLDAAAARRALDDDRLGLRRDVSLAWLDVFEAAHGLTLARQLASEAALQVRALEKDYGNGGASQADWLAAQVEAGLADDRAHDALHRGLRARASLARWIGDDAGRPLSDTLPPRPSTVGLPVVIAAVDHHPMVGVLDQQLLATQADVSLARQAYRPDVSVEGYYAYRQDYADFVGLQVSVDLPYFTKNRQDREVRAALAQSSAVEARRRDLLRELHARAALDFLDRQHFNERVDEFDRLIGPDAQRRVDAARSAYESGRGSFDAVLLARRGLLDTQLQRLALAVDAARAQVRLDYLAASDPSPGDAP